MCANAYTCVRYQATGLYMCQVPSYGAPGRSARILFNPLGCCISDWVCRYQAMERPEEVGTSDQMRFQPNDNVFAGNNAELN